MAIKSFSSTLHPTAALSDMLNTEESKPKVQTDIDYRAAAEAAITVIRWLRNPEGYNQYDILTAIRIVTLAEAGVINAE